MEQPTTLRSKTIGLTSPKPKEVITHNATDIKIILQRLQSLIVKKFMFRVSHGVSRFTPLPLVQWVGNRHVVSLRLRSLCLPT